MNPLRDESQLPSHERCMQIVKERTGWNGSHALHNWPLIFREIIEEATEPWRAKLAEQCGKTLATEAEVRSLRSQDKPIVWMDPLCADREDSFAYAADYTNGTKRHTVALYEHPAPPSQPIAWVSPEQFAQHDPQQTGKPNYLPVMTRSEGLFTMPLYGPPIASDVVAAPDAKEQSMTENERQEMFARLERLSHECNCGIGGVVGPCPFHGLRPDVLSRQSPVEADTQVKPLDDPRLQEMFSSAISGAMWLGYQNSSPPPEGHWLSKHWKTGRATAIADELRSRSTVSHEQMVRIFHHTQPKDQRWQPGPTEHVFLFGDALLRAASPGRIADEWERARADRSDTSQGVSEADELNEAAKDFYNLTIGDARVRIKAFSNESRDAIVKAGERLRAALRSEPTGEQS